MTDLKKYQPSAKQLEEGEVYEFSRNGEDWFAGTFCGMRKGEYVADEHWAAKYIRKCQKTIGKIKPKPVELIDGEYYLFDYEDRNHKKFTIVGKCDDKTGCFVVADGVAYFIGNCTNIRRLKVVEE